ncbi:MAG TPA: response regulator [Terracidiphilus sp.]|nr:response regulator [Terracidiphilus sp.]
MTERGFKYRILFVDDDPLVRETSALILMKNGYEVRTSQDGFAALVDLRSAPPDLIICDLRMPNMSGFELLSVVRRRFPHIPVIAISGEFVGAGPTGLIADAFLTKGQFGPEILVGKITELIARTPMRPQSGKPDRAPVWVPVNDRGYLVLTCTDCLRSFSVPLETSTEQLCEAECPFCTFKVCYLRTV